jgi:diguanylate cyclase (GGDEF)-like protein/PAS domain S-box-containing protein
MLVYVGVLRFLGRRERRGWLVFLVVALMIFSSVYTFVVDRIFIRGAALFMVIAAIFTLASVTVHRAAMPAIRMSTRFLAVVFGSTAIFYGVLALVYLTRADETVPVFEPTPLYTAAYLGVMSGTILWIFGLVLMVSERLKSEVTVEAENMRRVFASSPDCAIITRLADGAIVDVNDGFTRVTGYQRDEAIGRSTLDLHLWHDPEARDSLLDMLVRDGECVDVPVFLRRKDSTVLECLLAARILALAEVPHIVSLTRDVTDQRRVEALLLRDAATDSLTGVANRRHFLEVAARELDQALLRRRPLCMALIDIDNFKSVNDLHGHAAGDAAIVHIVTLFKGGPLDVGLLARLGGDEFGLLLSDTDISSSLALLQSVRNTLSTQPLVTADALIQLSFSAGIAAASGPRDTVDGILARADAALYEAKAAGRDRIRTAAGSDV